MSFLVAKSRYLETNLCDGFIFFHFFFPSPSLQSPVQTLAELEMVDEIRSVRNGELEGRENPQIPEILLTPFIQAVIALKCCVVTGVIV